MDLDISYIDYSLKIAPKSKIKVDEISVKTGSDLDFYVTFSENGLVRELTGTVLAYFGAKVGRGDPAFTIFSDTFTKIGTGINTKYKISPNFKTNELLDFLQLDTLNPNEFGFLHGEFQFVEDSAGIPKTIKSSNFKVKVYSDVITSISGAPTPANPYYPDPSLLELKSNKNISLGYAGLDVNGDVNDAQIPANIARLTDIPAAPNLAPYQTIANVNITYPGLSSGLISDSQISGNIARLVDIPGAVDLTPYQLKSEKNIANGYVGLNGSSLINSAQIGTDIARIVDIPAAPNLAPYQLISNIGVTYPSIAQLGNKIDKVSATFGNIATFNSGGSLHDSGLNILDIGNIIQGFTIANTPVAGQTLSMNGTDVLWTTPSTDATSINGISFDGAPSVGQVPYFDGSLWSYLNPILQPDLDNYQLLSGKDENGGYAGLDNSSLLNDAQISSNIARVVDIPNVSGFQTIANLNTTYAGLSGGLISDSQISGNIVRTSALSSYQLLSQKNSINGYAGLNASGLLNDSHISTNIARVSSLANKADKYYVSSGFILTSDGSGNFTPSNKTTNDLGNATKIHGKDIYIPITPDTDFVLTYNGLDDNYIFKSLNVNNLLGYYFSNTPSMYGDVLTFDGSGNLFWGPVNSSTLQGYSFGNTPGTNQYLSFNGSYLYWSDLYIDRIQDKIIDNSASGGNVLTCTGSGTASWLEPDSVKVSGYNITNIPSSNGDVLTYDGTNLNWQNNSSAYEFLANKNQVNGYAGLDGSGLLIDGFIPSTITRNTALANYQLASQKNVASGYAGLTAGTLLNDAQISTNIARVSAMNSADAGKVDKVVVASNNVLITNGASGIADSGFTAAQLRNATSIQGNAVSAVTLTNGQTFIHNGSIMSAQYPLQAQFLPSGVANGHIIISNGSNWYNTAFSGISITNLQGTTFSNTPSTGNYLGYNGTNLVWSTPSFTIPVANTLYVDGVNGNDGTGLTGRQDKPFLTIAAAITASTTNNVIVINPGTYAESSLAPKNLTTLYFTPGAIINSSAAAHIFTCTTNIQFDIRGYGEFTMSNTGAFSVFNVNSSSVSKNYRFECSKAINTSTNTSSSVFANSSSGSNIDLNVETATAQTIGQSIILCSGSGATFSGLINTFSGCNGYTAAGNRTSIYVSAASGIVDIAINNFAQGGVYCVGIIRLAANKLNVTGGIYNSGNYGLITCNTCSLSGTTSAGSGIITLAGNRNQFIAGTVDYTGNTTLRAFDFVGVQTTGNIDSVNMVTPTANTLSGCIARLAGSASNIMIGQVRGSQYNTASQSSIDCAGTGQLSIGDCDGKILVTGGEIIISAQKHTYTLSSLAGNTLEVTGGVCYYNNALVTAPTATNSKAVNLTAGTLRINGCTLSGGGGATAGVITTSGSPTLAINNTRIVGSGITTPPVYLGTITGVISLQSCVLVNAGGGGGTSIGAATISTPVKYYGTTNVANNLASTNVTPQVSTLMMDANVV